MFAFAWTRGAPVCLALAAVCSCIVVASEDGADATETATSVGSSGPGTVDASSDDSTATPTTAAETTGDDGSSSDADGDTGPPPLVPPAFPVHWGVQPSELPIPEVGESTIDLVPDVHTFEAKLSQTPASIEDPEAFFDEFANEVEAAIPVDANSGIGVIHNTYYEVPWCAVSTTDRDDFAASAMGAGLSSDELAAAWEAQAQFLLLGLLSHARQVRPNLEWGVAGFPKYDHWPLVDDDPEVVGNWRACHVLDPSLAPVWNAVDLAIPLARYHYASADDSTRERNIRYIERLVVSALLSGKRVVPFLEGRYVRSNVDDMSPYRLLPLLADDVHDFVEASRLGGAEGFIYGLNADDCWNFDEGCDAPNPDDYDVLFNAYWADVVFPVLVEFQSG